MKKLLSVLVALTMVLALVPSAILAGAYMNVPTTNVAIYTPQDLLNFCAQLMITSATGLSAASGCPSASSR